MSNTDENEASITRERQCDECGKLGLRRFARAGRVEWHKGFVIILPEDLALIECEGCGERYDSDDDCQVIDDLIKQTLDIEV